jgi:rod shape-determining protein MreC
MFLDHRQGHLELVRSALSTFVYPIQAIVNLPIALGRWASDSIVTRSKLIEENTMLREVHQLLNSRLQRYEVLAEENKRLRELLGSTISFKERIMIAELLAVELEQFRKMIEINKGSLDGVYDGQPVVDAQGIIGQVIHVGPFSSNVLMITDPSHSIPVQVNRNGLRAIAVGTGQNDILLLEHLPTNSDIRVGDLLVSSGLGRRFPRGYPVGTVTSINLEPGAPFGTIKVGPSAMLAQNREVLLVWPQDQENKEIISHEEAVNNESD